MRSKSLHPRHRRRVLGILGLAAIALTSACTSVTSGSPVFGAPISPGSISPSQVPVPTSTITTFGYGPSSDPSVKYQPDVVRIGGGPTAIRSVSTDGLTWTMDGTATGVADLAVGKIMFASGSAVGRVVAVRDAGPDRDVTVSPVALTDLVTGGSFDYNQKVDFGALARHDEPGWPGAISPDTGTNHPSAYHPRPTATLSGAPTVYRIDAQGRRVDLTPTSGPLDLGGWKISPRVSSTDLGVSVAYNTDDFKFDGDLDFTASNLAIKVNGQPGQKNFAMEINGLTGLKLDVQAGIGPNADLANANQKITATLPISFSYPIPPSPLTYGLPLWVNLGFSLNITTALGSKNATITAAGEYGLSGTLGVEGTTPMVPDFSVKKSLLDSIKGISLTADAVVVAVKMNLMLGVGFASAQVGPHVFITAASGLLKGSQIAVNPDCHFASLDIKAGVGVGLSLDSWVLKKLQTILQTKIPTSADLPIVVIHRQQALPSVAACTFTLGSTL